MGNSFGIVVPARFMQQKGLAEEAEVNVLIQARQHTRVEDIFGLLRGRIKKPTARLMREVDEAFEVSAEK